MLPYEGTCVSSCGLLHRGLRQDLPELVLVGQQCAARLQDVQLQLLAPQQVQVYVSCGRRGLSGTGMPARPEPLLPRGEELTVPETVSNGRLVFPRVDTGASRQASQPPPSPSFPAPHTPTPMAMARGEG